MDSKMPKTRKTIDAQAIGIENRPVWKGPGLNFAWPQTTLDTIGINQARLFPATASENNA